MTLSLFTSPKSQKKEGGGEKTPVLSQNLPDVQGQRINRQPLAGRDDKNDDLISWPQWEVKSLLCSAPYRSLMKRESRPKSA